MAFQFLPLSESPGDGSAFLVTGSEQTIHLVRQGCYEIITLYAYNNTGSDAHVDIEIDAPSSVPVRMHVAANSVSLPLSFCLKGVGALTTVTAIGSVSSGLRIVGHVVQDHGYISRQP